MNLQPRHARRRARRLGALPMTSMIDVVFLLLIFFIMTASFVKTERETSTATRVERKAASQSASDLEIAIIDIVADGDDHVYEISGRKVDSDEELIVILRAFENKADGAYVRATNDDPYNMAAKAIRGAKAAGFLKVWYVPVDE